MSDLGQFYDINNNSVKLFTEFWLTIQGKDNNITDIEFKIINAYADSVKEKLGNKHFKKINKTISNVPEVNYR